VDHKILKMLIFMVSILLILLKMKCM